MSAFSRLPLTVALLVSAVLELVLHRVGSTLIGSADLTPTFWERAIDWGGLYTFYLTGILGLVVFTWAVVVLIRDRWLLSLGDRTLLAVSSALFLPLAAMGQLFTLPVAAAPHLNIAFGLTLVALLVGFLRRPANLRAKLGVIYLSAPLLLHAYWLLTQQVPALAPEGELSELPFQIYEVGEHLLVVGAFAAFLFFAPLPRRPHLLTPGPLVLALVLTGGAALLYQHAHVRVDQAVYHGLGINLPPPSIQVVLYLVALFVFLLTLFSLLREGEPALSSAIGLSLVAVSGYHLQLPYQLLLSLVGMMELMRSAVALRDPDAAEDPHHPPPKEPSVEEWKSYLARLATACSRPPEAGESVVLQNDHQRIAHARGQRDGLDFTIRLLHGRGRLEQVEILVGEVPREPAPLTLRRRRGGRGSRLSGAEQGRSARLSVPELARQFAATEVEAGMVELFSADSLTADLVQHIHGWLGVWAGEGVRYLTHPGPDGWPVPLAEISLDPELASTDELEGLLDLLVRLARRAEVSPSTGA